MTNRSNVREFLGSRTVSWFSIPRLVERSVRISRTTLSCLLPVKGYETYRAGATFGSAP
jgi:hypothetical protein